MRNGRVKRRLLPNYLSIVIGAGAAVLVSLIGAGVCALCIHNEYLNMSVLDTASGVVVFISSAVAVILSAATTERSGLFCSAAACISYYAFLLCAALLFFDGVGKGALTGALICVVGGICGVMLRFLKAKPHTSKKHKRSIR